MLVSHIWSPGLSGVDNQDSLFLLRLRSRFGELSFAAVCDGIGGLSEGKKASGLVTEKLMELIYTRLIDDLGKGHWKSASNAVYRCLYELCRQLAAYGKKGDCFVDDPCVCLCTGRKSHAVSSRGFQDLQTFREKAEKPLSG